MRRNVMSGLVALLIVSAGFLAYSHRALSQESCITGLCHSTMLKAKNVHPVAQGCDTCHQAEAAPHPQKGKATFKLIQEPPQLCAMCHPNIGTKKNVHNPVKNGMCTTCHNPHDSNHPKLLTQTADTLCTTCHPDKQGLPQMHGPAAVGDCLSCHNPHDSDTSALAVKEGAELCLMCHGNLEAELKKKNVHPAIMGGCTSCHNPHGSAFKKFLSAEGEKLCFQCHPQIAEKVEKGTSVHPPIKTEKSCASCHTPHASDGEKLMAKAGVELCLDCHKGLIKKAQKVLHGPIRDGKCTACHDPHATTNNKLLVKGFPADLYLPYSDKEYELCFTCHNRDLLRYPDTSFATGFRDGDRNLHFLHVNRQDKGRSCKNCHLIHASEDPKLIAEKVSFGKWELPLRFIKTETGGSCSPGCHKTFNYDRKTPGKAPEPEKPKEKGKEEKKK